MRFFGEMAKFLKSNQQCMFLGRCQFGEIAIWGEGSIPLILHQFEHGDRVGVQLKLGINQSLSIIVGFLLRLSIECT